MIPREEIIKQINRFYDLVETKRNEIQEAIHNNKEPENYDIELDYFKLTMLDYFKLTSQIGTKMQYVISDLKNELDMLEDTKLKRHE